MSERLPDHDLEVLVQEAAEGVANSRAAHSGTQKWDDMAKGLQNAIREQALPFIFHGTKALAGLGYRKPRTVVMVAELDALGFGAAVLDANSVVWVNDGDPLDPWASLAEGTQGGPIWCCSDQVALPATVLHEGRAL